VKVVLSVTIIPSQLVKVNTLLVTKAHNGTQEEFTCIKGEYVPVVQ
jgi:hypothetical protein